VPSLVVHYHPAQTSFVFVMADSKGWGVTSQTELEADVVRVTSARASVQRQRQSESAVCLCSIHLGESVQSITLPVCRLRVIQYYRVTSRHRRLVLASSRLPCLASRVDTAASFISRRLPAGTQDWNYSQLSYLPLQQQHCSPHFIATRVSHVTSSADRPPLLTDHCSMCGC